MTVEYAKQELEQKRKLLNKTRKEIDGLKAFIVANDGELDKVDNSGRNFQIRRDYETGKTIKELSLTYKLTAESIKRIYDRQKKKF